MMDSDWDASVAEWVERHGVVGAARIVAQTTERAAAAGDAGGVRWGLHAMCTVVSAMAGSAPERAAVADMLSAGSSVLSRADILPVGAEALEFLRCFARVFFAVGGRAAHAQTARRRPRPARVAHLHELLRADYVDLALRVLGALFGPGTAPGLLASAVDFFRELAGRETALVFASPLAGALLGAHVWRRALTASSPSHRPSRPRGSAARSARSSRRLSTRSTRPPSSRRSSARSAPSPSRRTSRASAASPRASRRRPPCCSTSSSPPTASPRRSLPPARPAPSPPSSASRRRSPSPRAPRSS